MNMEQKRTFRVLNADEWIHKIVPENICVNSTTGNIEVSKEFFLQVWNDHTTDDSWRAWLCVLPDDTVIGCMIIQTFVHESHYFRWGPPLNKRAAIPAPSGEVCNVAEISFLCAKGCGSLLLQEGIDYVKRHTKYSFVVVSSTLNAVEWYRKKGFQDIKAYRLPYSTSNGDHLYRHRIPDCQFQRDLDPPNHLLFIKIDRALPLLPLKRKDHS